MHTGSDSISCESAIDMDSILCQITSPFEIFH